MSHAPHAPVRAVQSGAVRARAGCSVVRTIVMNAFGSMRKYFQRVVTFLSAPSFSIIITPIRPHTGLTHLDGRLRSSMRRKDGRTGHPKVVGEGEELLVHARHRVR